MRCEPSEVVLCQEPSQKIPKKTRALLKLAAPMAGLMAALLAATLAISCGGSGMAMQNPPPPPAAASSLFLVANGSGNVTGFSDSAGKLEPVMGSSVMFPPLITRFAAQPGAGTFLAAITTTPQLVSTLQIANISAGGALTLTKLMNVVTNPGGTAISSQGVIAVTDFAQNTVQLMTVQNNQLLQGASAATGPLPQDAVFSADGSRLYVGNNADGTISVFAVSKQGAMLQPLQTAHLPMMAGEFAPGIVRVALSPSGKKFATTTFDGRFFVGNVSAMDGTLSGITETVVAAGANLEEVVFDPAEKDIYTADLDNGGIFGFMLGAGGSVTPLPGSPFSTGALPGGPAGMAFNSAGGRLYVVMSAQSAVFTYSHDVNTGQLALTGDVVSSGGFLAGRIARVPEH